jgi:hypothetical protein
LDSCVQDTVCDAKQNAITFKNSVTSTYFWACWVVSFDNEQPFLQVGELFEGIRGHLDDLWLQVDVPLPWPLAIFASLLLTGSKRAAIYHGYSCIPSIHAEPLHLTVGLKQLKII